MNFRRLVLGVLPAAVLALTGCFHGDKCCHEAPRPQCCPAPGGVVPAPGGVVPGPGGVAPAPVAPPASGFYYGPPSVYGR
jgi:hypothetical protein